MKVECKKCNQEYEVEDQYAGQQVQCQCGAMIDIPDLRKEKTQAPVESGYLPGFKLPVAAKIFNYLMIFVAGFVVIFIIQAIGTQTPQLGTIAVLAGAILIFGLYVSKTVIVCLAEIAYNTRQIARRK